MNDYNIKELYEEMEMHLIKSMRRNLSRHLKEESEVGFDYPQWQAIKLKELKRYQKENKDIIKSYVKGLDKEISEHLQKELRQGSLEAIKQYNKIHKRKLNPDKLMTKSFFRTNQRKVNNLIKVVNGDLNKVNTSALRMMNDQYRQIIHKSAFFVGNGVMTEKQVSDMAAAEIYSKKATMQAVDEASKNFLAGGLNCIEYKDGRRVNIASYSEMAVRTASLRAHLMGEGDFRKSIGRSLVKVTTHGGACKICTAWQGKVLVDDVYSGGEPDGKHTLLSKAMSQGFLHPNCKHGLTTYYPELEEDNYEEDEEDEELQDKINYYTRQEKKFDRLSNGSLYSQNKGNYQNKIEMVIEKEKELYKNKWSVENVYINDLDSNVVKEIDKSIEYNFSKYPELKKQINGIGSIQGKNKSKIEEIQKYYENLLEINNPDASDLYIKKYALKYAKDLLPRAPKNAYAISSYREHDRFKLNGIYIHNKWGNNFTTFIKSVEKDVRGKWHPDGTASIKAVVDHEFGHQLDCLLDLQNNSDIIYLWKSLSKYQVANGLSRYANKNIKEFIAEAYSEYVNNDNCRDIAMKVGNIIEKEYAKRFKIYG